MYFVDKDKLVPKIKYLSQLIKDYETSRSNHYVFERIAQMLIGLSVDIGSMIIDVFILGDPGNYKDVVDILELEGAISKDTQNHTSDTVEIRKQLAHHYIELEVEILAPLFDTSIPYYRQFVKEVTQFLKKESVLITAFGEGDYS